MSVLLLSTTTLRVESQILYYCNFDTSTRTDNCFTSAPTSITPSQRSATSTPNAPISDVTAILQSPANGHVCKLPHKSRANDIYFCNAGTCGTVNNGGVSACTQGKFATFLLSNNNLRSMQLKIPAGSITSTGQNSLTYYYHMSTQNGKSLAVRKVESNGVTDILGNVTSVLMNAWTQRNVQLNAIAPDYTIFFDIQRTSGVSTPYVSLDEISIEQESCDDPVVKGRSTSFSSTSSSSSSSPTGPTIPTSSSSFASGSSTIQSVTISVTLRPIAGTTTRISTSTTIYQFQFLDIGISGVTRKSAVKRSQMRTLCCTFIAECRANYNVA